MKKMLKTLSLCAVLFMTANLNAEVAYNTSSLDEFMDSAIKQGKAEGFTRSESKSIVEFCVLELIRKEIANSSIKDLEKIRSAERQKFAFGMYDYSSAEALFASFALQAQKEGFPEKEAGKIVEGYLSRVKRENEDEFRVLDEHLRGEDKELVDVIRLKLLKKYIGDKSILEMKEYQERSGNTSYYFRSFDDLDLSIIAQGAKEGFNKKESLVVYEYYENKIYLEKEFCYMQMFDADKDYTDAEYDAMSLIFLERYANGRTIAEMKAYVEKDGTVIVVADYDYSSTKSMEESFIAQGKKEGFSEAEIEDILRVYLLSIKEEVDEELTRISAIKDKAEQEKEMLAFCEKYIRYTSLKKLKEYSITE